MKPLRRRVLLFFVFLIPAACAPPMDPPPLEAAEAAPTEAAPTETFAPTAADTDPAHAPTLSASPQPTETPTGTPRPTLTAWETVQQAVGRFRNRLDSASEGYNGLTTALEQPGPNEAWCQGLAAAVNDFVYVKDVEAEGALVELQAQQGCP